MTSHTMIVLIFALSTASLWLGMGLLYSDRRHARRMVDREATRREREAERRDRQILLNRIQDPQVAVTQTLEQSSVPDVPTIRYDDDDAFFDAIGVDPLSTQTDEVVE